MPEHMLFSLSAVIALVPSSLLPLRRGHSRDGVFWAVLLVAVAGPLAWVLTAAHVVSGIDSSNLSTMTFNVDGTTYHAAETHFNPNWDNMVNDSREMVQRPHHFAIVDEVDSILVDEARTPLIISGSVDDRSDLYISINDVIPKLKKQEIEDGPGDYSIDEKSKQAYLTEDGHETVEQLFLSQLTQP